MEAVMQKLEFWEDERGFYSKWDDLVHEDKCPFCGGKVETMKDNYWFRTFACQNKDCLALFEAQQDDVGMTEDGEDIVEACGITGWRP